MSVAHYISSMMKRYHFQAGDNVVVDMLEQHLRKDVQTMVHLAERQAEQDHVKTVQVKHVTAALSTNFKTKKVMGGENPYLDIIKTKLETALRDGIEESFISLKKPSGEVVNPSVNVVKQLLIVNALPERMKELLKPIPNSELILTGAKYLGCLDDKLKSQGQGLVQVLKTDMKDTTSQGLDAIENIIKNIIKSVLENKSENTSHDESNNIDMTLKRFFKKVIDTLYENYAQHMTGCVFDEFLKTIDMLGGIRLHNTLSKSFIRSVFSMRVANLALAKLQYTVNCHMRVIMKDLHEQSKSNLNSDGFIVITEKRTARVLGLKRNMFV